MQSDQVSPLNLEPTPFIIYKPTILTFSPRAKIRGGYLIEVLRGARPRRGLFADPELSMFQLPGRSSEASWPSTMFGFQPYLASLGLGLPISVAKTAVETACAVYE